MAYDGYRCLKFRFERGVLFVTINNPPINILDLPLMLELDRLGREIETDDGVKVVVFDSANPDFFIAHVDVGVILQLSTEVPPKEETLGFFHAMVDRFRTMPKWITTIVQKISESSPVTAALQKNSYRDSEQQRVSSANQGGR